MKFYIYKDDGTNYLMILDHNTSGNVAWITESAFLAADGEQSDWDDYVRNTKGPITVTARLNEDTEGWAGNPRLITADEIAHIVGADTAYDWDSTDSSNDAFFYLDGSGSTSADWQNSSNNYSPIASSSNKSNFNLLMNSLSSLVSFCHSIVSRSHDNLSSETDTDAPFSLYAQ